MSLEKHEESDFSKVSELVRNLDDKGDDVFLLFMASRREDGVRWCPDCVQDMFMGQLGEQHTYPISKKIGVAEPIINKFLEKCSFKKNDHLITVDLEKAFLRDPTNPYYTSEDFKLRKVPTLMKWKGGKQLEEEDCMSENLLKSLFQCIL